MFIECHEVKVEALRVILWMTVTLVVLAGVGSLVPTPLSKAKEPQANTKLYQDLAVTAAVSDVLNRACINCHSNETRWPRYSSIAPVSWLVENHVLEACKQVNFSRWQEYGPEGQRQLLEQISEKVKEGAMPPGDYALMHREARLTVADRTLLMQWSSSEADKINTPSK